MGASASVTEKSIHEFMVKDAKGRDVNLSTYKGKVLLVVNVASKCGFTNSNYTQLTELYSKYKDRGMVFLGLQSSWCTCMLLDSKFVPFQ
uniref:Glutathione peroxidase n=1 Tax=Glycine max TaxID=3847 RepID=A0A0R0EYM7_SOYBN